MQWEGSWRQLEASSRQTSFAVREQSGHSFKSSLRHIMTVDHRDHPIFPSSGVLLKLVQEYAGLGGDVAFVKHDSELQANVPLPAGLVSLPLNTFCTCIFDFDVCTNFFSEFKFIKKP